MVKMILLKCDNRFFYKMSRDKLKREFHLGKQITWESYIKILFGFRQ